MHSDDAIDVFARSPRRLTSYSHLAVFHRLCLRDSKRAFAFAPLDNRLKVHAKDRGRFQHGSLSGWARRFRILRARDGSFVRQKLHFLDCLLLRPVKVAILVVATLSRGF